MINTNIYMKPETKKKLIKWKENSSTDLKSI